MSALLSFLSRDEFDRGKLDALYERHGNDGDFARELARALVLIDPDLAWRATWLLLRLARERRPIDEASLGLIAEAAGGMTQWAARLQLCQFFGLVACPPRAREVLYPFLAECFADRRVIVRAWALSALMSFRADPDYRRPVNGMIATARRDPGKSMQARLRHLLPRAADVSRTA